MKGEGPSGRCVEARNSPRKSLVIVLGDNEENFLINDFLKNITTPASQVRSGGSERSSDKESRFPS